MFLFVFDFPDSHGIGSKSLMWCSKVLGGRRRDGGGGCTGATRGVCAACRASEREISESAHFVYRVTRGHRHGSPLARRKTSIRASIDAAAPRASGNWTPPNSPNFAFLHPAPSQHTQGSVSRPDREGQRDSFRSTFAS